MKKTWIALLMAVTLLHTACSAQPAVEPSFVYEGVRYCTTGKQVPATVDESAYLGYIESTVPPEQWPVEEKQANLDCRDAPFARCDGEMLLLVGSEWTVFEPAENAED